MGIDDAIKAFTEGTEMFFSDPKNLPVDRMIEIYKEILKKSDYNEEDSFTDSGSDVMLVVSEAEKPDVARLLASNPQYNTGSNSQEPEIAGLIPITMRIWEAALATSVSVEIISDNQRYNLVDGTLALKDPSRRLLDIASQSGNVGLLLSISVPDFAPSLGCPPTKSSWFCPPKIPASPVVQGSQNKPSQPSSFWKFWKYFGSKSPSISGSLVQPVNSDFQRHGEYIEDSPSVEVAAPPESPLVRIELRLPNYKDGLNDWENLGALKAHTYREIERGDGEACLRAALDKYGIQRPHRRDPDPYARRTLHGMNLLSLGKISLSSLLVYLSDSVC